MQQDQHDNIDKEAHSGMCLVDEQGLIVGWSPGQEAITGLGRMEALGRAIWDIQYQFLDKNARSAEEYGRLKKVFTQILNTGQVPPNLRLIEINLARTDGALATVQILASPIKTAAGYMLSCLFRDVTTQKRMELALQEARAEAELANRAKGDFLARMSHEIRTPLHGITGMTDLLSHTELTAEQHQYLDTIRSSADLLLEVVNDILDYSKIESGRLDLEETAFDLREIVEHASDTVALKAFEKNIELVVHLSPTTPTRLVGDPGRLQQVLVNLLSNAVKFTEKGQVLLRVRAESKQSDTVTLGFMVEDTGMGIAQDKLISIFESFRQGDDSTTRRYGGTGLGLPIAAQLVELMGGQIQVESKLKQGSRFLFSITCRRQSALDPIESPPEWQDAPVLIICSNAAACLALVEILSTWGLQATASENSDLGLLALDRARAEGRPFRLVLLDSSLPDNCGFKTAKTVKAGWPGIALVVFLSPARIHNEIEPFRLLGANAWLSKPIKYLELRRTVETVLRTGKNVGGSSIETVRGPVAPIDPSARGLKILLADDNRAGQMIGESMLKELGHNVEAASNGQEVLEKLAGTHFDLILMDLEMPQMDGCQALRIIRQKEAESGDRRIPIVAVTADVSKERCYAALRAGMDGYLPKPFKMEKLRKTLEPFLALSEPLRSYPVYDHTAALEATGGSEEILAEVFEIFLDEDYPRHLIALTAAIEQQDGELLRKTAHGLKGALASFGGSAAAETALQLQEIGMRREMALAPEKLVELEGEIGRFVSSFRESTHLGKPSISETS